MNRCIYCGITDRDGAPDQGIPYPEVIERPENANEMICKDCNDDLKDQKEPEDPTPYCGACGRQIISDLVT